MRSYHPGNEEDEQELKTLLAEPWMVELLKLNPGYVHWGPYEDYMYKPGDDEPWHAERAKLGIPERRSGWEARILYESWAKHEVQLDELNEVVNFYFSVNRDSKECPACKATGYHPDAMWISETFYEHMADKLSDRGIEEYQSMKRRYPKFAEFVKSGAAKNGWHTSITQDEVDALVAHGRLYDFTHTCEAGKGWQPKDPPYRPTAEEVNKWERGELREKFGGLGHDGINRYTIIEQRLKRLEIPQTCPKCDGKGNVYTADHAHVSLTYWLLHPRKGASRGVEVKRLTQPDLPQVFAFLKNAAERNAGRFAKVVDAARRCT